jgi:uncharacterized protein YbjQ (UPF0145 family)
MVDHQPGAIHVTTTFSFEGYRIVDYRGIVRGIIVCAPTITQGNLGTVQGLRGGRGNEGPE